MPARSEMPITSGSSRAQVARDHMISTVSSQPRVGDIAGVVRRRLLVNSWADPDEVAKRLPTGMRPHVGSGGGVVVGCCMIEIESARPWPLPRRLGVTINAAAHRISVETGPPDAATRAVYVPMRHTDSRLAVFAGGRVFPGVHAPASVVIDSDTNSLSWSIRSESGNSEGFDITASASLRKATEATSELAEIVIGTTVGLSPARSLDRMETIEMRAARSEVLAVELTSLDSEFLASFTTAEPAETLLMNDAGVTWRPASKDAVDVVG